MSLPDLLEKLRIKDLSINGKTVWQWASSGLIAGYLMTSLANAQILNIRPTTNTGDTGKQVRVIAKRGEYIALDTSVMLGESVSANYGSVATRFSIDDALR